MVNNGIYNVCSGKVLRYLICWERDHHGSSTSSPCRQSLTSLNTYTCPLKTADFEKQLEWNQTYQTGYCNKSLTSGTLALAAWKSPPKNGKMIGQHQVKHVQPTSGDYRRPYTVYKTPKRV